MARTTPLESIPNIGIMAHIDGRQDDDHRARLYYTGRSYKIGEVHEGHATMDWMEQSRSAASRSRQPRRLALERSPHQHMTPPAMSTSDRGRAQPSCPRRRCRVFDSVAGVEPQSETVWRRPTNTVSPHMLRQQRTGSGADSAAARRNRTPARRGSIVLNFPVGAKASSPASST